MSKEKNIFQNPAVRLFLILFSIGFLISSSFFARLLFRRMNGHFDIAGRVISVSGEEIRLHDRRQNEFIVFLQNDTRLNLSTGTEPDSIKAGMFILVSGKKGESGEIKAFYIQSIDPPPERK